MSRPVRLALWAVFVAACSLDPYIFDQHPDARDEHGDDAGADAMDAFDGEIADVSDVALPDAGPRTLSLCAGGYHTCALRDDHTVWCWGANYDGQLGLGNAEGQQLRPVQVPGLTDVVGIAAGSNHTCARQMGGQVYCWGLNTFGQVGDGTMMDRTSPTPVPGLSDAVLLVAGGNDTCAARASGTIACWGQNTFGQLGAASPSTPCRNMPCTLSPTPVQGLARAAELSTSGVSACARQASGAVSCWGHNVGGELGDGTTTDHTTPAMVPGIMDASRITVGSQACVVRADHTVWCWGNGTPVPRAVAMIADASLVTSGDSCTYAIVDGGVRCWGSDAYGQCAGATVTVPISGLSGVVDVAAGSTHGCALRGEGSVWCWGANSYGQLGNGMVSARSVPTQVQF